jgi:hypothetical protein
MSIDDLFDVPAPQCQLLKTYLKTAVSLIPKAGYLYESESSELLGVASTATGTHQCSRSAELLRAFYCLEAVHVWLKHLDNSVSLEIAPGRVQERTWQGLARLREQLRETRNEAEAHTASLCLYGRETAVTYATMTKAQLPNILTAARMLEDMAERVQQALGREEPGLRHMGALLATSIQSSGVTSLYVIHARNLINITEENGISPWETKELQELFSI